MGWRDRDWAKFTDAERDALYGRSVAWSPPPAYEPPSRARTRRFLAPGAGLAIAVTAGALFLSHGFHIRGAAPQPHHTFPLNLSPTATYGSTLTLNGTDPNASSGTVVATGQWNGGPWTTLASSALASDHTWSIPLPMNQQGTLNIRIALPSGDSLVGSTTVQP